MKRQIRCRIFETNSSSVHSLTMCIKSDFDRWKAGQLAWSRYEEELVPITDEIKESMDADEREFLTHDQFNDYFYIDHETFKYSYETPNGDRVVAFGFYGQDY